MSVTISDRKHAQAQEIDFDDAEVRAIVFVPLNDDAGGHRCRFQRYDLVEAPFGHHHPAGVLPEVAWQILDLQLKAHEMLHAQIVGIETCCCQLAWH
jgi:hypothetical protein